LSIVYQGSAEALAEQFFPIVGRQYVHTDAASVDVYGRDHTMHYHFGFQVLVKPGSVTEISQLLKICNQLGVPLVPRGGGSGVTGGALPVAGGVVLSLERLSKIVTIDPAGSYVVAEAGVVTATLCEAVAEAGFYFPVPPSSQAYSCIGGNVAVNAGSIHSCRYGSTAQYVLNLEVVLPSGEVIWTGANVAKNATGLNLTQLFVGSEGTLGIITKVVYRLLPQPGKSVFILAGFESPRSACDAVIAIKRSGIEPSAVEFIDSNALQLTSAYLKEHQPLLGERVAAQLLIELQASQVDAGDYSLNATLDAMVALLEQHTGEEILLAESTLEKQRLTRLRFSIGDAMTSFGRTYRDLDACVPLGALYNYLETVATVCAAHRVKAVCFGHALDGNLHTMLLLDEVLDPGGETKLKAAAAEIYRYAVAVGGVLSGEHGIGMLQREFMSIQFSEGQLALMQSIKQLLDPNHILNPGKIL
jgi:glycolate oxidase